MPMKRQKGTSWTLHDALEYFVGIRFDEKIAVAVARVYFECQSDIDDHRAD